MDADPYLNFLSIITCNIPSLQEAISFETPTLSSIIAIAVTLVAIFISAFISGSETSFFSLSQSDIDEIDSETKRNKIKSLIEKPEHFLATILITNNLVNVTIIMLLNFALSQIIIFRSALLDFIFQSVVLTFILLLFGEILPKLYANDRRIGWAKATVNGLTAVSALFSPLSKLMAKSTFIVNKVVTKKADALSLDDLSHALEITAVDEAKDKTMLKEILKFGGKTVSDVMTPRIDMEGIDYDTPFDELIDTIRESGYSRMPVYAENPDNIKGVIYAKDLLPFIGRSDNGFKWQKLLREPLFVPENRMIDDILEDFRTKKVHMAIVVDEYGGTQGLVTLEDVLEEIVGEINDEYDEEEKTFTRLSNDTFIFQGKTQLNDFFRVTGMEESEFEDVSEDAETIAGLLLNIKHDFPKEKELIEYGRCKFRILEVDRHRIESVKVRISEAGE